MPFKTGYHNVSLFGEKMARVFVLPQSFGHYKLSHSTRGRNFCYLVSCFVHFSFCLKVKKKNSINKATYRFVFPCSVWFSCSSINNNGALTDTNYKLLRHVFSVNGNRRTIFVQSEVSSFAFLIGRTTIFH